MKKKILFLITSVMLLISAQSVFALGDLISVSSYWYYDNNGHTVVVTTYIYEFGNYTTFSNGKPPITYWIGQEDLPNNYGVTGGDTTKIKLSVYPNPSNLDTDVNVMAVNTGLPPTNPTDTINVQLEIYHLQNGAVVRVGGMMARVGETYTINRQLINNTGIYRIVGRFNYLGRPIETYSLIMRK